MENFSFLIFVCSSVFIEKSLYPSFGGLFSTRRLLRSARSFAAALSLLAASFALQNWTQLLLYFEKFDSLFDFFQNKAFASLRSFVRCCSLLTRCQFCFTKLDSASFNSRPAGDDHALDFGGAFIDFGNFGVPHHSFYRVVPCKAVAAE